MTITFAQLVTTVGLAVMVPTLTALIGILVSNDRFTDLSKRMDDLSANMVQHRNETQTEIMQFRNQIHTDIQMLINWERDRDK